MQDEAKFTELLAGVRKTNRLLHDVRKYLCGLNIGAAVMLVLLVLIMVQGLFKIHPPGRQASLIYIP